MWRTINRLVLNLHVQYVRDPTCKRPPPLRFVLLYDNGFSKISQHSFMAISKFKTDKRWTSRIDNLKSCLIKHWTAPSRWCCWACIVAHHPIKSCAFNKVFHSIRNWKWFANPVQRTEFTKQFETFSFRHFLRLSIVDFQLGVSNTAHFISNDDHEYSRINLSK